MIGVVNGLGFDEENINFSSKRRRDKFLESGGETLHHTSTNGTAPPDSLLFWWSRKKNKTGKLNGGNIHNRNYFRGVTRTFSADIFEGNFKFLIKFEFFTPQPAKPERRRAFYIYIA